MKLSDFDYPVPEGLIAKEPLKVRDSSRLFVLNRETKKSKHLRFREITSCLSEGDLLILNNTKVIPARLFGTKPSGGRAEITLLREIDKNSWEALVKGMNTGTIILTDDISAKVSRSTGTVATVIFKARISLNDFDIKDYLEKIGVMPLPPYMKRESKPSDHERYQTVYAENEGAVAAPTAGFHFTDNLLTSLKSKGIEVRYLTLHIGYGTFRPVTADDIRDHSMDEESYDIPDATASAVKNAKDKGRRIIAVGTTVTRALESAVIDERSVKAGPGKTSIFIYPGYRFRIVEGLLTNFHLPGSTPMMLASAFAGLDLLKQAYEEAIKKAYRLYSYGDSMLIL